MEAQHSLEELKFEERPETKSMDNQIQNKQKCDFSTLLKLPNHSLTRETKEALENGELDINNLDEFVLKLNQLNAESKYDIVLIKNDMFGDSLVFKKEGHEFEVLLGLRVPEKDINNERHRAEFMMDRTKHILESVQNVHNEVRNIIGFNERAKYTTDPHNDFMKFFNYTNAIRINAQNMYDSLWEFVNHMDSTDKFISKRSLGGHLNEFHFMDTR